MKRCFTLLLALALLPALAPAQVANNRLVFVADLSGQQEVPPVSGAARGVATFLISPDRTTLSIHGVFSGLSGPITGCHVHNAPEGVSGPIFTDLGDQLTGQRLRAEIPLPVNFLAKALEGVLYLNVHTAANPSGEIRGQLVLQSDILYGTAMDGASEVPPVASNASGVFKFVYSPGQTTGQYYAVVDGLSGPITVAHLHNAPLGMAGPVFAPLTVTSDNTLSGELDFSALPDFLDKLEANALYVNVHTDANPGGEIRGQVHSPGRLNFDAVLNGAQETPAVATDAAGIAVATLTNNLDTLVYKVSFHGLVPVAAHFHRGAPGVAGPVIVPLTLGGYPNFYGGRIPISAEFASDLLNGNVYVNLHTMANPGGEIRGQMQPLLRTVYTFDLCGEQEVPPTGSAAEGAATISLDRGNTNLSYLYLVDGLSGPAVAAHIHTGAPGFNGPVLDGVALPAPVGSGQLDANQGIFDLLEAGNAYLNVHTALFPGGEVRGQIGRALRCAANVATQEPVVTAASVFPNPAAGRAEIRLTVSQPFTGQILLSNATGQLISRQQQSFLSGEQMVTVDLAALPAGLYFIQLKTAQQGTVGWYKLVRE